MKVDEHIARAIAQYIDEKKILAKDFARLFGVSEPAIVKWRRPGSGIVPRHWVRLFDYIKKYLPPERIYVDQTGAEQYISMLDDTRRVSRFSTRFMPQMIPKLTPADLTHYNAMLQSVEQYANSIGAERVEYRQKASGSVGGSGMFCFQVPAAAADIPKDAMLYISTEAKPKPGCLVVSVLANDDIVIGRYTSTGTNFTITAGERIISGSLNEARDLFKLLLPVISYEVTAY